MCSSDLFATGLGGMALTALMGRDLSADSVRGEAADLPPHHPPQAKRAIQIFLQGGLSQLESFDYKPQLEKLHGKSVPGDEKPQGFMGKVGLLHRPHFAFKQRGASGLWVSELFPHLEWGDILEKRGVNRAVDGRISPPQSWSREVKEALQKRVKTDPVPTLPVPTDRASRPRVEPPPNQVIPSR